MRSMSSPGSSSRRRGLAYRFLRALPPGLACDITRDSEEFHRAASLSRASAVESQVERLRSVARLSEYDALASTGLSLEEIEARELESAIMLSRTNYKQEVFEDEAMAWALASSTARESSAAPRGVERAQKKALAQRLVQRLPRALRREKTRSPFASTNIKFTVRRQSRAALYETSRRGDRSKVNRKVLRYSSSLGGYQHGPGQGVRGAPPETTRTTFPVSSDFPCTSRPREFEETRTSGRMQASLSIQRCVGRLLCRTSPAMALHRRADMFLRRPSLASRSSTSALLPKERQCVSTLGELGDVGQGKTRAMHRDGGHASELGKGSRYSHAPAH